MSDLPAYSTTTVDVGKSPSEIREVLRKHGAQSFQFGEGERDGQRLAGVEFTHRGLRVLLTVPIKVPTAREVERIEKASKRRRGWLADPFEWAEKRTWRVISWTLRARLIAVAEEVETFEQAFLSHIVNPSTGRTIYSELSELGRIDLQETVLPQLTIDSELSDESVA